MCLSLRQGVVFCVGIVDDTFNGHSPGHCHPIPIQSLGSLLSGKIISMSFRSMAMVMNAFKTANRDGVLFQLANTSVIDFSAMIVH